MHDDDRRVWQGLLLGAAMGAAFWLTIVVLFSL